MSSNLLAEALKHSSKTVLQDKNIAKGLILDTIRDKQLQAVMIALLNYDIPMQLLPIVDNKDLQTRVWDICNHLAQQCPYKESVICDALSTWIRAIKEDDSFVLGNPAIVIGKTNRVPGNNITVPEIANEQALQKAQEEARKKAENEAKRKAEEARINAENDARNKKIESALYDICRKKGKSMEVNGNNSTFDNVVMELKVRGIKDEDIKKFLEQKKRGEVFDITMGDYAYKFTFYSDRIYLQKILSEQGRIHQYMLKDFDQKYNRIFLVALLIVWGILLVCNALYVFFHYEESILSWVNSIISIVITFFAAIGALYLMGPFIADSDNHNPFTDNIIPGMAHYIVGIIWGIIVSAGIETLLLKWVLWWFMLE